MSALKHSYTVGSCTPSVTWSADNKWIITASYDGYLRYYRLESRSHDPAHKVLVRNHLKYSKGDVRKPEKMVDGSWADEMDEEESSSARHGESEDGMSTDATNVHGSDESSAGDKTEEASDDAGGDSGFVDVRDDEKEAVDDSRDSDEAPGDHTHGTGKKESAYSSQPDADLFNVNYRKRDQAAESNKDKKKPAPRNQWVAGPPKMKADEDSKKAHELPAPPEKQGAWKNPLANKPPFAAKQQPSDEGHSEDDDESVMDFEQPIQHQLKRDDLGMGFFTPGEFPEPRKDDFQMVESGICFSMVERGGYMNFLREFAFLGEEAKRGLDWYRLDGEGAVVAGENPYTFTGYATRDSRGRVYLLAKRKQSSQHAIFVYGAHGGLFAQKLEWMHRFAFIPFPVPSPREFEEGMHMLPDGLRYTEEYGINMHEDITYHVLNQRGLDAVSMQYMERTVPFFSEMQDMHFRSWNAGRKKAFYWSAYMALDGKRNRAYYLMTDDQEMQGNLMELVFDKGGLIGTRMPSERYFSWINYATSLVSHASGKKALALDRVAMKERNMTYAQLAGVSSGSIRTGVLAQGDDGILQTDMQDEETDDLVTYTLTVLCEGKLCFEERGFSHMLQDSSGGTGTASQMHAECAYVCGRCNMPVIFTGAGGAAAQGRTKMEGAGLIKNGLVHFQKYISDRKNDDMHLVRYFVEAAENDALDQKEMDGYVEKYYKALAWETAAKLVNSMHDCIKNATDYANAASAKLEKYRKAAEKIRAGARYLNASDVRCAEDVIQTIRQDIFSEVGIMSSVRELAMQRVNLRAGRLEEGKIAADSAAMKLMDGEDAKMMEDRLKDIKTKVDRAADEADEFNQGRISENESRIEAMRRCLETLKEIRKIDADIQTEMHDFAMVVDAVKEENGIRKEDSFASSKDAGIRDLERIAKEAESLLERALTREVAVKAKHASLQSAQQKIDEFNRISGENLQYEDIFERKRVELSSAAKKLRKQIGKETGNWKFWEARRVDAGSNEEKVVFSDSKEQAIRDLQEPFNEMLEIIGRGQKTNLRANKEGAYKDLQIAEKRFNRMRDEAVEHCREALSVDHGASKQSSSRYVDNANQRINEDQLMLRKVYLWEMSYVRGGGEIGDGVHVMTGAPAGSEHVTSAEDIAHKRSRNLRKYVYKITTKTKGGWCKRYARNEGGFIVHHYFFKCRQANYSGYTAAKDEKASEEEMDDYKQLLLRSGKVSASSSAEAKILFPDAKYIYLPVVGNDRALDANAMAEREPETWKKSARIYRPTDAFGGALECVKLSGDGSKIAVGMWASHCMIYSSGLPCTTDDVVPRHVKQLSLHSGPVMSVAWGPEDKLLATGSADGRVLVWEVSSGLPVVALAGHQGYVQRVDWCLATNRIASGGYHHSKDDKSATIWVWPMKYLDSLDQLYEKSRQLQVEGKEDVLGLAWSPNGLHLAASFRDYQAVIYRRNLKELKWEEDPLGRQIQHSKEDKYTHIHGIAWSSDGKSIVTGGSDRCIRRWALTFKAEKKKNAKEVEYTTHLEKVEKAFDARNVNACQIWGIECGRSMKVGDNTTRHSMLVASASEDKTVKVFDFSGVGIDLNIPFQSLKPERKNKESSNTIGRNELADMRQRGWNGGGGGKPKGNGGGGHQQRRGGKETYDSSHDAIHRDPWED